MKYLRAALAALLALAVIAAGSPASAAAPVLTAKRLGAWTHPSTWHDPFARSIEDLAIIGQEAYGGWGNYDSNIGPVPLSTVNVTTGTETPARFTLNGEEANALRVYSGKLYVPDIDPKVSWSTPVGYATNATPTRRIAYVPVIAAQHVYDFAELGSERFIAGSMSNPDPARFGPTADLAFIAQSSNGGPWEVVRWRATDPAKGHSGYDRYYWLAVAGGKVFASAKLNPGPSLLDVWDGQQWREVPAPYGIQNLTFEPHYVQAFGSLAVGRGAGNEVWVLDSATELLERGRIGEDTSAQIMDFAADGSTVYALLRKGDLAADDEVWRSVDGVNWTLVAFVDFPVPNWFITWHGGTITTEVKATASALAVRYGDLYLGTNMGDLWVVRNGAD